MRLSIFNSKRSPPTKKWRGSILRKVQVAPGFSSLPVRGQRASPAPNNRAGRAHLFRVAMEVTSRCGAASAAHLPGGPGCPFATLLGGKPFHTPVSFWHVGLVFVTRLFLVLFPRMGSRDPRGTAHSQGGPPEVRTCREGRANPPPQGLAPKFPGE